MRRPLITDAVLTGETTLLPVENAPSSPEDGQIWVTASGIFARVNGVTNQLDAGGVTNPLQLGGLADPGHIDLADGLGGANTEIEGYPGGLQVNGAIKCTTEIAPSINDGASLGTTALKWSDLFLASGSVINFNAGDVTITHSSNTLAFAGASNGYTFDTGITIANGVITGSSGAVYLSDTARSVIHSGFLFYPSVDAAIGLGAPSNRWNALHVSGTCTLGSVLCRSLIEANTAGSGSPNVLTANESRTTLTNEGTTAENYHTLPTAAAGYDFEFICQDSDGIRIVAASGDTIRDVGTVSATAGYIRSSTIGSVIRLRSINATEWYVVYKQGTWTIDS